MAEKLYKPLLIDSLTAKVDLPKQVFVDFEGNICTAGKKAFGVCNVETDKDQLAPIAVLGILLAIDICIYRLYSRRIYTDMPETISENYKNAIRTLEQLKKGVITLETSESTEVKTSGEYRTNKTELDRIFNKKVINFEY